MEIHYNKRDAAYTFKASIKDLFVDNTSSVEIKRESDTIREQRRRYVRLDISEDITYRIIDSPENKNAGMSPEFNGMLLNISAGGFLFETENDVKEGALLICNFGLKNHHTLQNILAVVKRAERSEDHVSLLGVEFITAANRSEYGLEKLDDYLPHDAGTFNENLQKLIVQYIYTQQVKMRKEGRL